MCRALVLAAAVFQMFLAVHAVAADADAARDEPLYLGVREPELKKKPPSVGLLFREIPRQAFLIAARDACGLATRDTVLREEFPPLPNDKSPIFELQTIGKEGKSCEIRVYIKRKSDAARRVIWHAELPMARHGALVPLVEKAEALSRGEFQDLLHKEGFGKSVPAPRAAGPVPREVDTLLSHWSEIDTFHALRLLHGEIHEKGESPELLAALAIAYANLGVLTDRQWSTAHKAYEARALLYAERLVQKTDSSPWALAHRAYAWTLVGLHKAALADIESLRARPSKSAAGRPIPSWVDVLALFCDGRSAKMADSAKKEPESSLALVLRMLEFDPTSAVQEMVDASKALLEAHPTCHRAAEGMCAAQLLNVSHMAIPQSLAVFRKCLEEDLDRFPGLPDAVRKKLAKSKGSPSPEESIPIWTEIITELREAGRGDRAEPSLSAFGGLVQEMAYLVAFRRLHLEGRMLAVPTAESLALFRPLVEHHPYACNLESMSTDPAEYRAAVNKLYDTDFRELDFPIAGAMTAVLWHWKPGLEIINGVLAGHADETYRDLVTLRTRGLMPRSKDDKQNAENAAALRSVSPRLGVVISILVDIDWKTMKDEAPRLEQEFARAPFVLTALANKYIELKRWDDAERCLTQKIRSLPSFHSYRSLATVYKEKGDMDRWKKTLDDSLELPSMDLESTRVRVDLAEYHVKRKEYRKAVVYADEAAQSYASWALHEAARCHELLEDWKAAEKLMHARSERYEGDAFAWMLWCYRTGHGDTAAAEDLARRHFESLGTPAPIYRLFDIATYYLLLDEPQKALVLFNKLDADTHELYYGLHAALLCDRLGDEKGRDSLLARLAAADPKQDVHKQHWIDVAQVFRAALASGNPKSLDFARIERALQKTMEGEPTNAWYFIGTFLQIHGDKDKAREYLGRCATSPIYQKYNHILARVALRKDKIPIGPPRDAEVPKP